MYTDVEPVEALVEAGKSLSINCTVRRSAGNTGTYYTGTISARGKLSRNKNRSKTLQNNFVLVFVFFTATAVLFSPEFLSLLTR